MKINKTITSLIIILIIVVMVSGCTNSTPKSPNEDLYIDGTPLIEQTTQDSNGNYIGGNGILGEWGVMISIRSKSQTAYSDIKANVTLYDKNNNVISSKVYTIPYLEKGLGKSISISSKTEVDHVNMTIINATPEK